MEKEAVGKKQKPLGMSARHWRHGLTGSAIYRIWAAMKRRCYNPNVPYYRDYGGRGIKVCNRWYDAESFAEDMGEPPLSVGLSQRASQ